VAAAVLAVLLAPAPGRAAFVDAVLVTVDGTPVTASDVALARTLGVLGLSPSAEPIGGPDLERLVRARLMIAEAERVDLEVTDEAVAAVWQEAAARHGGPAALDAWLASVGVEREWARRMARDEARRRRFVELRFQAFVFVLEADVAAALGPGEHGAEARDGMRERLRAEAVARRLDEWLREATERATVRRVLGPGERVPVPWPMPPRRPATSGRPGRASGRRPPAGRPRRGAASRVPPCPPSPAASWPSPPPRAGRASRGSP
jgi:hypothetical protein